MRISLASQVALVACLPMLAYMAASTVIVNDMRSRHDQASALVKNIDYVKTVSNAVMETQRERGKTSLFLGRAIAKGELDGKRAKTDEVIALMKTATSSATVSDEDKEGVRQAVTDLSHLRSAVDSGNANGPEVLAGYTSTIAKLLKAQVAVANITEVEDIDSRIRGISIVEDARENAGRLRASVTAIVTADSAIDKDVLGKILQYYNAIGPVLGLNGLQLSTDGQHQILALRTTQHWQMVAKAMDIISKQAEVGGFKIDSTVWFDAATKVYDDIGTIIAGEVTQIAARATNAEAVTKQSLLRTEIEIGAVAFLCLVAWLWTFRSVVVPLKTVTTKLHSLSHHTLASSHRLTASSRQLSESATQLSAAAHETDASLSEMSSMITQSTRHTADAETRTVSSFQKIEAGKSTMNHMLQAMQSLDEANGMLKEISTIIDEMSKKTNIINDIAFKTQLLSFNASIEAERAGQHGRGFAVVANEVSNLAIMSSKAAGEVESMLKSGRDRVSQIIEATGARISEGHQISTEVQTTFADLAEAMAEVNTLTGNIKNSAKEQEIGIRQISAAMSQINASTAKTQRMAEDSSQLSSSLSTSATQLSKLENVIKIVVSGDIKLKRRLPKSKLLSLLEDDGEVQGDRGGTSGEQPSMADLEDHSQAQAVDHGGAPEVHAQHLQAPAAPNSIVDRLSKKLEARIKKDAGSEAVNHPESKSA